MRGLRPGILEMGTIRFLFGLFMLAATNEQAVSCSQYECDFGRIMIPTYGHGMTQTCMQKVRAAQVDFSVNVPHQDESVLDYYKSNYTSDGWSQCDAGVGWQKFQTQTNGLREIERRLTYFANQSQEELLMVSLMHPLREYHDGSWRQSASKEVQKIRVVLYDLSKNSFDKHISALGIECE